MIDCVSHYLLSFYSIPGNAFTCILPFNLPINPMQEENLFPVQASKVKLGEVGCLVERQQNRAGTWVPAARLQGLALSSSLPSTSSVDSRGTMDTAEVSSGPFPSIISSPSASTEA